MKILITRSSGNQTIGGAELSARDQAIVLGKLGHTPSMSTNLTRIRGELSSLSIPTYPNLFLQRFEPPLRYIYFWGLFSVKLVFDALLVLSTRPDVINPHTREDQISYTLMSWLHRRPVVWKDPGDMVFILDQSHGLAGRLYKNLYLSAARKADHIYVLNDEHAQTVVDELGDTYASKVSSIPSSILYEHYSYAPKAADGSLVFGSICRLETSKNISSLIEAYQAVADQIPDSKLVIVGDGPDKRSLEELAGGDPRIEFTGHQTDISACLNNIDIFVHPATAEGWGRSIKEAMYFGKAIIGSNVGGIAKQISSGVNGLLVELNSPEELKTAMLRLATDRELRHALSANARQKAIDDGDFADIVEKQILPIYRSVTD